MFARVRSGCYSPLPTSTPVITLDAYLFHSALLKNQSAALQFCKRVKHSNQDLSVSFSIAEKSISGVTILQASETLESRLIRFIQHMSGEERQ